jgi:hypothetical protein
MSDKHHVGEPEVLDQSKGGRERSTWVRHALTVGIAACVLSGCGSANAPQTVKPTDTVPGATSQDAVNCPPVDPHGAWVDVANAKPLTADTKTVFAFTCTSQNRVTGDGTWTFTTERHALPGPALDRFLATLRSHDETNTDTKYCLGEGMGPQVGLVDENGTVIWPRIPIDGCGTTLSTVVDAWKNLTWVRVGERKTNPDTPYFMGNIPLTP